MTIPPHQHRDTLLHDVQAVLAAAFDQMHAHGWRRHTTDDPGRADRLRLVDALNYASAAAHADPATHRLVFACAAMAVEPHLGRAAHTLLPDPVADAYLSPATSDADLHRLDAAIIVRFNLTCCVSTTDAEELLRRAHDNAPEVIDAQYRHGRTVPA